MILAAVCGIIQMCKFSKETDKRYSSVFCYNIIDNECKIVTEIQIPVENCG